LETGVCRESIRSYRPFGAFDDQPASCTVVDETKAFVGERYDMDAGLYYLNARYMDPALGMFLQPDWFEVNEPP
jgi:RHS repeat-associated protein